MMKSHTDWRWSEVDGRYVLGKSKPAEGTAEISAIDAFRNNTMLVLGCTGFVGKILLAMILARFPELKHLVVQVRRKKKDASGEQRFYSEILQSPPLRKVFDRMSAKEKEAILGKVQVVEGDLDQPLCGIDAQQLDRLRGQVDVVVNVAGVVDFKPPVTEAFQTNVYGTQHVIDLVRLLNAKLVHISTSYVAGKRDGRISEDIPISGYFPFREKQPHLQFSVSEELKWYEQFVQDMKDNVQSDPRPLRERLREGGMERAEKWGWTNTYTYTKSLGEQLIAQTPGLTYSIVRPAIVESSLEFPFEGWNEGLTTSAPLVLMGGEGVKDWPVREDGPLEIIPVDLVAAGILIITAAVLGGKHRHVYHLASADENKIMLRRLVAFLGMNSRYKHKHKKSGNRLENLWKAYVETRVVSPDSVKARRDRLHRRLDRIHSALTLGKSLLGSQTVDPFLKDLRVRRRVIRAHEITIDQFRPFMCDHIYVFETRNIRDAARMLTSADLARINWEPKTIDWADYWVNIHTKGIEKWIRPVFSASRKTAS